MIRLFINAFGASAGGGITYVLNVLPHLAVREDVHVTALLGSALRSQVGNWPNVAYVEHDPPEGVGRRFWFEQSRLPEMLRRSRTDVLLSAGNFALWNSPVPQILLSRNALYTSSDFLRDVRNRGDYGVWLDTEFKAMLARCSIQRADATVAPSAAFADDLRKWSGTDIITIHHGFDAESFHSNSTPLPLDIQSRLNDPGADVRLLFVSNFNYYRNFGTLLRALPVLKKYLAPKTVKLFLTCKLVSAENPGSYRADSDANLVHQLGITDQVVELGAVPYGWLHRVYQACDIYVTPAYAESFAHPLVEAMSTGLPVVASDLAVHREICGDAAVYFPSFSAKNLAQRVMDVWVNESAAAMMRNKGVERSRDFSWRRHVDELLVLASRLVHLKPE
jgi:glycosyltransferase involved in cell wall biosynthesis